MSIGDLIQVGGLKKLAKLEFLDVSEVLENLILIAEQVVRHLKSKVKVVKPTEIAQVLYGG